ncbi:apolipoprotein F [Cygnus atratus]|uniref:apolipoprotein F n=1 Tax=Cygnus atratus TaxID=8868 RepID=UPI0015D57F0C|nr:apolipoprotein F [Cygnus atratus]
MPQALLFLLLLLLLLLLGLGGGSTHVPTPLEADARGLLAELAPPQALRGRGVSCRVLHPEALPGFSRLPPLPRALARAALALALSGATCGPEAEATVLGLHRELGTPAATALLRGLAGLRDTPSPRALPLLFSLVHLGHPGPAGPCSPRTGTLPLPHGVPAPGRRGARAWPPRCRRAARARRDGKDDACSPPGEQEAHGVLEWVPGVSLFYNLGTSIYFAFQGCEVLASERALEVAQDLGYAGLAALTAGASGPVAMGLGLGLQPGLKAGVRALFGYFTAEGEAPTAPATYSGPVLIV